MPPPQHPPRPDWVPDELYPFEDRYLEVDGHLIHYVDDGEGPLLLMVHGNPDWSFLYRDIILGLRDTFRCVALDFPGFGMSKAKEGWEFTPDEQAEVLVGFIEALDLRHVTMMVQDWGGPLGLWAAGRVPERMRALIIGSTLAWPEYAQERPWWVRLMMGWYIGSEGGRARVMKGNQVAVGYTSYGGNIGPRKMSPEVKRAYLAPFETPESRLPTWVFAHHLFGGAGLEFLTAVEKGLAPLGDLPVLFVWGTSDSYTTAKSDLPRFKTYFPNHTVALLEGVGHWYQEVAPDQTVAAVRSWWPEMAD